MYPSQMAERLSPYSHPQPVVADSGTLRQLVIFHLCK